MMSETKSKDKPNDQKVPAYFQLDKSASMDSPVDLKVTGQIPKWLKGSLYRNGSGIYQMGDTHYKHLFDGLCMLTRWTIQDGSVSFQATALDTDMYKECVKVNRLVGLNFGTYYPDPCKSLFSRLFSYFKSGEQLDNTSVSIVELGDKLFALTETLAIHEVNPKTMLSERKIDVSKYLALHLGTAHPHVDRDGSWIYYGTACDQQKAFNFVRVPPQIKGDSEGSPFSEAEIIGTLPSRWRINFGYTHSFGLTENYIVHFEQPLAINLLRMMTVKARGVGIEDAMINYPNEPIKIHVMNRKTGERVPINYYAPHGFVFHFINAYEDCGFIVCDVCLSDSGSVVRSLYLDEILGMQRDRRPYKSYFARFVLPLKLDGAEAGKNLITLGDTNATAVLRPHEKDTVDLIRETSIDDTVFFELPRINYDYNGRKYRYAYGTSGISKDIARLVKVDTKQKKISEWNCPAETHTIGEPVFVPSPDGKEEDDGIILSAVLAEDPDQPSYLIILDASTFTELARATLPDGVRCNFSFHGCFSDKVF